MNENDFEEHLKVRKERKSKYSCSKHSTLHIHFVSIRANTFQQPCSSKVCCKTGRWSRFVILWGLIIYLTTLQRTGLLLSLGQSDLLSKCPMNIYPRTKFCSFRIFLTMYPKISSQPYFHSKGLVSMFSKHTLIMESDIRTYTKFVLFPPKRILLSSNIWTKILHLLLKMPCIIISWTGKRK